MKKYILIKLALITFLVFSDSMFAQTDSKSKFAVTVNNQFEKIEMSRKEFEQAVLSVKVVGSKFDDHILLSGFKIKFPGQQTIVNEGDKLNDEAIKGLAQLDKGDQIIIYDAFSQHESFRTEVELPIIITITKI